MWKRDYKGRPQKTRSSESLSNPKGYPAEVQRLGDIERMSRQDHIILTLPRETTLVSRHMIIARR